MPKIEKAVLQNDPSETGSGAHKPKTPGQSQEDNTLHLGDHSLGGSRIMLSLL